MMSLGAAESGGETVDRLTDALGRAAAEAAFWRTRIADLELGLAVDGTELAGRALQGLDEARQGMEGLQIFLSHLAGQVGPSIVCSSVNASRRIPMRAQAERLGQPQRHGACGGVEPEVWAAGP